MKEELIWLTSEMIKEPGYYVLGRTDDLDHPYGLGEPVQITTGAESFYVLWDEDCHQALNETDPEMRWFGPLPRITY